MDNKSLLFGIAGFLLGGLLVSIAATTFDKPEPKEGGMAMHQTAADLADKRGDDYDKAFIANMIRHHQDAIDMAGQSADRARHDEIRILSAGIISTQQKEIDKMRQWQTDWGYSH